MPTKRRDRVVIDTNLWISFLLTKDFSKLDTFFSNESIVLLFSQELLDEFVIVAGRPKLKKYFSLPDLDILLSRLNTKAKFIEVSSRVSICRDPKDNFLLSLAKDGSATHILTGAKDLLVLKKIGRTKIMTITEYLS
jgi:putative PIN family toxin of toxin-antitoxin system